MSGGARNDDASGRDAANCTNCGDPIDTSRWYPITTRIVDGDVELYSFCDDDCRDAWDE